MQTCYKRANPHKEKKHEDKVFNKSWCSPEFSYGGSSNHWEENPTASKEVNMKKILWAAVSSKIYHSRISHFILQCPTGMEQSHQYQLMGPASI